MSYEKARAIHVCRRWLVSLTWWLVIFIDFRNRDYHHIMYTGFPEPTCPVSLPVFQCLCYCVLNLLCVRLVCQHVRKYHLHLRFISSPSLTFLTCTSHHSVSCKVIYYYYHRCSNSCKSWGGRCMLCVRFAIPNMKFTLLKGVSLLLCYNVPWILWFLLVILYTCEQLSGHIREVHWQHGS